MKTENFIVLTVLIVYSIQVSHQSANQETELASTQTWPEENQPEGYREEEKVEEETQQRPRGKRRRRLRKRQRAQLQVEEIDRTNNPEYRQEHYNERSEAEGENVTPVEYPRRRPGKRRRRPYRRYQDDENTPPKPPRRRRKGGRNKIRPEVKEEKLQTETPQEYLRNNDNYEMETTTPWAQPNVNLNTHEQPTDNVRPTESYIDMQQSINKIKDLEEGKIISNAVKSDREEIDAEKSTPYGNKIFDRKKLFSNSRRLLPVTSAVIRRLSPTGKANVSETQNELAKAESKEKFKVQNAESIFEKSKPAIKTDFVSEHHVVPTNIAIPEISTQKRKMETKNKVQIHSNENDTAGEEEPNYPKILPKPFLYKKIEQEMTANSVVKNIPELPAEKPKTTFEILMNKSMEEEFEKMLDNFDLNSFNISNFDDYIIDLLKTKSGKEYLSKILESRNMTIGQLLEHRERGSSKFHLFEMFPQRKHEDKSSEQAATSTSNKAITETSSGTPHSKEMSSILFPSEEIMESFPKFMAGEIESYEKKANRHVFMESTTESIKESREPRLFESMPEFTTKNLHSILKEEKPTWRVIPNPKFRPVSVRGNYEEIPVSHILNRPLENNINDIYIVDEAEGQIHKKYGLLSTDSSKRDGFGFRKIPVGIKSAIIISAIIVAMATFGFLSILISCRVRQKRSILRAKQDLMCEHLQNEDFMASQQNLSPVLKKHQQVYSTHDVHSNPNNRHYYLWRTLRRTFRYD